MSSSTISNTNLSNTEPRKRLIIKLSYPPGTMKRHSDSSDTDENKRRKIQHSEQPTVTCYWVDSCYKTKTTTPFSLSQPKGVKESSRLCSKSMLTKDSSKTSSVTKEMVKNQVSKIAKSEESSRTTSLIVKDSSKNTSVTKDEEYVLKKPMECVKRRQCWLILKRMLAGRDGWDLKDPPAMESKSLEKKSKAIGLKEIERKMRLYATPDEFARDMRLVFSNAMLMSPPRNHIYQIAKKFSYNFELKWKSLKDEWELEDRKRRKAHKTSRY
ncbi:transcription factor GTE9-like [Vicia villosa]|uniref:transcription factor GTE9-like n=1 Tax=Vicia villosa TaxID=3911 RepID=UPI00273B28EF|nr:transcription factor GTE9-like [Vicia villosa]